MPETATQLREPMSARSDYHEMRLLDPQPRWHIKALLAGHLAAGALVGSWLLPATRQVWDAVDEAVYLTLNGSLVQFGDLWQMKWAFANTRLFDMIAACIMISVMVYYIFISEKGRLGHRRLTISIFIGLYMLATIGLTREFIFDTLERTSPSYAVHDLPFNDLRELVPWSEEMTRRVKVESSTSFPGDHGTVTFIFTMMFWYFAGWRYGLAALLLTVWFTLPRMIGGAHWFSDLAVGSLSIAIITVIWGLATPAHYHCRRPLAWALTLILPKKDHHRDPPQPAAA